MGPPDLPSSQIRASFTWEHHFFLSALFEVLAALQGEHYHARQHSVKSLAEMVLIFI